MDSNEIVCNPWNPVESDIGIVIEIDIDLEICTVGKETGILSGICITGIRLYFSITYFLINI